MSETAGIIGGLFLIFISLLIGASVITMGVYGSYEYKRDIGSYFSNAVDCITPECALTQLELGKQGMIKAGLTPELYGAWIFKAPDNSMQYQYQHLDAIIERVKAVQSWKATANNGTGTVETMGDTYNTKMNNVRRYIIEGGVRSDWIAEDAWWLKNYFVTGIFGPWILILAVLLFIVGCLIMAA